MQVQITRSLVAAILLSSAVARADVIGVDRAWIDIADSGGTLKSVTVGGQVLADLAFATSGTVDASASGTNPDRTFWNNTGGTNPVTAAAALSGGIATDGLLNSEVTFQFGQSLSLSDVLVFLDAESGGLSETVQFFPVDGSGTKIGDYALTLSGGGDKSGSYGANLIEGGFELAGEDIANPISGFNLRGVTFTLADMIGTTGDLGLAQGFSIEDDFGGTLSVDPALAAIATFVPPSANFNGDAFINGTDLAIMASNYGEYGVGLSGGDANLDGSVDYIDYLIWRQASLNDPAALGEPMSLADALAAASVPEPSTVCLVAAAAGLVAIGRHRMRRRV